MSSFSFTHSYVDPTRIVLPVSRIVSRATVSFARKKITWSLCESQHEIRCIFCSPKLSFFSFPSFVEEDEKENFITSLPFVGLLLFYVLCSCSVFACKFSVSIFHHISVRWCAPSTDLLQFCSIPFPAAEDRDEGKRSLPNNVKVGFDHKGSSVTDENVTFFLLR